MFVFNDKLLLCSPPCRLGRLDFTVRSSFLPPPPSSKTPHINWNSSRPSQCIAASSGSSLPPVVTPVQPSARAPVSLHSPPPCIAAGSSPSISSRQPDVQPPAKAPVSQPYVQPAQAPVSLQSPSLCTQSSFLQHSFLQREGVFMSKVLKRRA